MPDPRPRRTLAGPRAAPETAPAGTEAATFSIGALARELGITTRAIRFYEAEGLLQPARNGQTRVYSERDRVRLRLILRGRRCAFSLSEIAEMLALYDAPEGECGQVQYVLSKLRERRRALERQRCDIDEMHGQLELTERRMCTALEHQKGL